jgi:hypothetical protein
LDDFCSRRQLAPNRINTKVYRADYYLVGMPHLLRQLSARDSRPIGQHQKFQQLKLLESESAFAAIDENSSSQPIERDISRFENKFVAQRIASACASR